MITLKLIEWFLSIPIFSKFDISQEALESIKSLTSYLYQINSFINLGLLVDTIFLCIGMLLVVCLSNLIRRR